jgi:drug/metabolite transporter (DMT)-like permease
MVPIYALALRKKAATNVWLAVGISIVGFYLLCIKSDLTVNVSDIFCLGGALIFPIHILTIDHFSPKCDGVRMSMVQFFTAAVVNLLMALIFEAPISTEAVIDGIMPILYLGIASSGIAYTLQIIGQRNVPPAAASIILSLESVFGVIGGAIILGSDMLPREYVGCAIVLAAVIIAEMDFKPRKSK